ncbi:hypothetical protein BLD48_09640 [Exiguobacterium sp. KRL4]|uniref:hypothetical protein n=1 Tax=Exiguobacterium sp. KRL4 TaxID=1914536 RepID=UPI0008F82ED9|nr:hypothetical protein [Exiguobacterium sp. KRL4]OIN66573.1 hypothetical protein BLD48_09640 [Exiguobacterium sp. KRL4]
MRKGFWLILLLVGGLILFFEPFRGAPPEPEVTVKGTSLETTSGSYCWHSLLRGQCVDYIYTTPLDMTAKQTPTVIKPGAIIDVTYNDGPTPKRIKVEEWQQNGTRKKVRLKDNQLTVPTEKGLYTYHVSAWWGKGDGNVAFLIDVK